MKRILISVVISACNNFTLSTKVIMMLADILLSLSYCVLAVIQNACKIIISAYRTPLLNVKNLILRLETETAQDH